VTGRLDACRDAAALIAATADRDGEAIGVILDHSDNREVATVLAIVVNATATGYGENFITELCDKIRHLRQPPTEGNSTT
jgi:hypothetical protein